MSVVKFCFAFLLCLGVVTLGKAVIPDDSDVMGSGDDPDDEQFDFSDDKNVLLDGKTSNENANTLELRLFRNRAASPAAPGNRTCCATVLNPGRCNTCDPGPRGPTVPICGTCTGGMSCGSCGPIDPIGGRPDCVISCQCCCSNGSDGSCKQCECGMAGCSVIVAGYPAAASARECFTTQACRCFRHAGVCQASCNPSSPEVYQFPLPP